MQRVTNMRIPGIKPKYENKDITVPLTPANIDNISEMISQFLNVISIENANQIRIRFSLEEAMLRWMDHFGKNSDLRVEIGIYFRQPSITLTMPGEQYNPLVTKDSSLGEWMENLYSGLSYTPSYSYRRSANILQLKLNDQSLNPAVELLGSAALGAFIGEAGKLILSDNVRALITRRILSPIEGMFLRILNAASGPIIFLSVMTAIIGIGMLPNFGRSGDKIVRRFLSIVLVTTAVVGILGFLMLGLKLQPFVLEESEFASVFDLLLGIVPNDIMTPFIEGNSPQLILLAIVLGNTLVSNSNTTKTLREIVEQAAQIGLSIANWVSNMTPFFVVTLLILGIWRESISHILGLWKPILVYAVLTLLHLGIRLLFTARKYQVPARLLMKKMKKSFLVAFENASVDASFGDNINCCEKKLGIHRKLTEYAVPLGSVLYMPSGCAACIIITLYAALISEVKVTWLWVVMAVLLTVVLIEATPPVAGIGLLTYSALFSQLGIPRSMLTMAMLGDITAGFLVSAANQALLQLALIEEARGVDLLDIAVLRSEKQ